MTFIISFVPYLSCKRHRYCNSNFGQEGFLSRYSVPHSRCQRHDKRSSGHWGKRMVCSTVGKIIPKHIGEISWYTYLQWCANGGRISWDARNLLKTLQFPMLRDAHPVMKILDYELVVETGHNMLIFGGYECGKMKLIMEASITKSNK